MDQRQRKRQILRQSQQQFEIERKRRQEKRAPQVQQLEQTKNVEVEVEEQNEDDDFEDEDSMPNTDMEDEYDDEYENEIIENEVIEKQQSENFVEDEEVKQQTTLRRKKQFQQKPLSEKRVWFNEEKETHLEFDNTAYNMLHRVNTEWPCLSCDFILSPTEQEQYKQKQFQKMNKYPYTVYLAAGTQAAQPSKNQIYLMKLSKLHKTKYDDNSSNDDSEDDDVMNDEEAHIQLENVKGLTCGVNRIKSMNSQPIVSYWSENGEVMIVNLKPLMNSFVHDEEEGQRKKSNGFNINQLQHKSFSNTVEGFALDWSSINIGHLASGSCDSKIYTYMPKDEADFVRDTKPYIYHGSSVEDIQWSPVENFAFASCSVDGTVQVCDTRVGNYQKSQILIKAHDNDVNVISWNRVSTNLIASGADDGCFKIWDLRYPTKDSISEIQWHSKPITSIQFQPNSDSTIAVSSSDNKLSIWDFAVENDDVEINENDNVPDQLMFVHQGQQDLKEIRYHPLYFEMLISTSANGFNIFKPSLDEESSKDSDEEKQEIPKILESDLDQYLAKLSLKDN